MRWKMGRFTPARWLRFSIGALVVYAVLYYANSDSMLYGKFQAHTTVPSTKRRDVILGASTNLTDWTFTNKVSCPRLLVEKVRKPSARSYKIYCNDDGEHLSFGSECLSDFIDTYCNDGLPVPNVLHYVWYGKIEVKYHHFLSFMSAVRFMNPCLIVFHGEEHPYGGYWDDFTSTYSRWVHVYRPLVTAVHGHKLSFKEHGSDIMRIEAVHKYGGLYIDTDTILLRNIHPLRRYNCTMGHEYPRALGSQFVMGRKGARFLHLWHEGYRQYRTGHWDYNALYVPYQLSQEHPELVHIEGHRFTSPNYHNIHKIYKTNFDWSQNYAMHLYIREYLNKTDEVIVRKLNTTYGAVSRHILFGNKELCQ